MGEGALRKDFFFSPGEWTDDDKETCEEFFQAIVDSHVCIRTGAYVGTGRTQFFPVTDLPGSPKLMVVQPEAGGSVQVTLVPYSGGIVSAWTHKGFTLAGGSAVNTQNTRYRYLILA